MIVEAIDFNGNVGTYEVGELLTWEERKKQVREDRHEAVYCLFENVRTFNHGEGLVATWLSIGKSEWEKCRRIIRKIK